MAKKDTATTDTATTDAEQTNSVEAFILRNCPFGKAGEVVKLETADAESGAAHGMLDLNVAAIQAAKNK